MVKTRYSIITLLLLLITSCNLVVWNQKRTDKKLNRNTITSNDLVTANSTVHYYKGGDGPAVLFIHGFGGDAQITWYSTLLELSKTHTVIAPDLLWFGKSNSSLPANLNTQSEEMIRLMNSLNIDTFSIAGISYGGFVALSILDKIPHRIHKLCIIDSPGMTYDLKELRILCNNEDVDDVSEIFVVKEPSGVQKLMDLAFYKDHRIPKRILNQTYELYFKMYHEQLENLLKTLPEEQARLLAKPPKNFPPSLVIWGQEDAVFPLKEGEKLANFINAEFFTIEKAGHAPTAEKFKQFYRKLESFLMQ